MWLKLKSKWDFCVLLNKRFGIDRQTIGPGDDPDSC